MAQEIKRLDNGNFALIVDGEWYAEGTYEQCSEMMFTNALYDGAVDDIDEQ